MDPKDLQLQGVIAFDGITKNGLRLHPDQENIIHAMGCKIVIRNLKTAKQDFLCGHKNIVSAVSVSPCGSLLASGQLNHYGFKAAVIIWDYKKRELKGSYEIHKVRVEDLCFTSDSNYLISLGGRDDGCLVVWDVQNNVPVCGSFASNEISGDAYTLCPMNVHANCFITAGETTFKVWHFNPDTKKLLCDDVKVGKLRRTINCVAVDVKDEIAYCGTTSGDIIKARLSFSENMSYVKSPIMIGCYSKIPAKSKKTISLGEGDFYSAGVKSLLLLPDNKIVVGAGDGSVELVEIPDTLARNKNMNKRPIQPIILTRRAVDVCSAVTSMSIYKDRYLLVGTALCEIYEIELATFNIRTLVTCHTHSVHDLAFPPNSSDIFATASKNDIRLWKLDTRKELLRISVPNFDCLSLCFDGRGQVIISAWNDGMIRGFALAGGKLVFEIHNAHTKAVSAIAITNDDRKLCSGGCDGQIRIWDAKSVAKRLLAALKDHRAPITCIRVSRDGKDLVSSSTDGTCVLWDITAMTRRHILMGNTMFMAACYIPSGVQVLTCGTDRKIAYWETLDGSLAREVEGSSSGTLNCIDVNADGKYFLTGSNDFTIKLWDYRTANVVYVGLAHAAAITACAFSPDNKYMVTVSADGAIMLWCYPSETDSSNAENNVEDIAPKASISRSSTRSKESSCTLPPIPKDTSQKITEESVCTCLKVPTDKICTCQEASNESACKSLRSSNGEICISPKVGNESICGLSKSRKSIDLCKRTKEPAIGKTFDTVRSSPRNIN